MLDKGINITSYNAISIEPQSVLNVSNISNVILTSQNGVRAILNHKIAIESVFCVGQKTKALLVKNGYNVVENAKNASELAKIIVKKYRNENFVFFCGNKRRADLPLILKENQIEFSEQIVYNTILNSQKIDQYFDGILFFSPSGVESYIQENTLAQATAFCIGKTTATAVQKHTKNIQISKVASVESLITLAIAHFNR